MYQKILVPDLLPNNLKVIREMRGYSVKSLAEGLMIDRNFLSAVETETKNFSGKTNVRALKLLNINFYQMYDVKEKRVLPVTDSYITTYTDKFVLDRVFLGKPSISDNGTINEAAMVVAIENYRILRNFPGKFTEYNILDKYMENDKLSVIAEVSFVNQEVRMTEFDINFVANENHKLAEILLYRGYPETLTIREELIDGEYAKIVGNKIVFANSFKIPRDDSLANFSIINEFDIDDPYITVKQEKGVPFSVKFKCVRPEINSLRAIRTIENLSIDEMHQSLDLSYNAYINLEQGNQKIGTKIMWKLVEKLKLPLELIINIDEYYEKFCKNDKKIVKKGVVPSYDD